MAEFLNIPADKYHADRTHVGHSGLRDFNESRPAYAERTQKAQTSALATGTLSHMAVWERDRFESEVIKSKYKTRCPSMSKEREENPGMFVVTESEYAEAEMVEKALRKNKDCAAMLERFTRYEGSLHWKDEGSGLLCKARPDGADEIDCIMGDLKSARDYGSFVRDTLLHSYKGGVLTPGHVVTQAGHYTAGGYANFDATWRFAVLLVVKAPYPEAGIIWLSRRTIDEGAAWCKSQLLELNGCRSGDQPWQSTWSRWPQSYDVEEGLGVMLTSGGVPLEGF